MSKEEKTVRVEVISRVHGMEVGTVLDVYESTSKWTEKFKIVSKNTPKKTILYT